MSLKALSDYTFFSRYAQYSQEKERRETWPEAVKRVFDMHRGKYAEQIEKYPKLKEEIDFAETQVRKKRVLGSQRALQYGGPDIIKHNARIYNCCGMHIDKPKAFQDTLFLLLAGCGVGFSVQKQHVAKLPAVAPVDGRKKCTYVVPDSIEGWADSLGVLLSSYFVGGGFFPEYENCQVTFDFSEVRPKGAMIADKFKAPGPEPLKNGLEKVRVMLERAAPDRRKLRAIEVYDILMHAADFVIAGGLRRSAVLALFSKDDTEMATAKTGKWFDENPQRGRSNNSAALKRDDITRGEFDEIFQSTRQFGEPGFVFVNDHQQLVNPSLRKGTLVLTDSGIIPIDELEDKDFQVKNLFGHWEPATCRLSGVNKALYKLKLRDRYNVWATPEHEWPIVHKNGFDKKPTKDLVPGDKIAKIYNYSLTPKEVSEGKGSHEDGFLIGWLYGDGSITDRKDGRRQYSFIVSNYDSESGIDKIILNKLNSLVKDQPRKLNWYTRETTKETYTTSSKIHEYMTSFGVDKKEFGLPKSLFDFAYSEDFRKGFIDGLFSADAYVQKAGIRKNGIVWSTSREKLCEDVIKLLGFYGFTPYKRHYKTKAIDASFPNKKIYKDKIYHSFRVSFNLSSDIYHFRKTFSLTHQVKQQNLEDIKLKHLIYPTSSYIKVTSSELTELKENVWDISVKDETHCFQLNHCVTGNCSEIAWIINSASNTKLTTTGFCNLSEINGKFCRTEGEFLQACRAASIIGTLQAGYADFPYLGKYTEEFVRKEALLGVSITGWMDNPDILFDPKILKKGTDEVKKSNATAADMLGINHAARLCTAKPSGHTSCILQTASGIHPHHAKRYLRRVQSNKQEYALDIFKRYNPHAVEESVWSANKTDDILTFLCEVPPGAIVKNQMSSVELLEKVKLAQKHWVINGINDELNEYKGLSHSVSNTITVRDEEWDDVGDYIFKNREYFTGISLLSASGDLDYMQAPFSTVLTPSEMVKEYGDASVFASGLIVDGLKAFGDNLWVACACALGMGEVLDEHKDIPDLEDPKSKPLKQVVQEYKDALEEYNIWFLKKDWCRRFHQFAERYFEGDGRKTSYCLKHTSLWKTWVDLRRDYQDVDWESARETSRELVDANTLSAQACSGSKCELT